jgi:uncharacterized protein
VALVGSDFRGGLWRRLYAPANPAGLFASIAIAVALVVLNQLLQLGAAFAVVHLVLHGSMGNPGDLIKAYIIGLFPASVLTAAAALALARLKGGSLQEVLALRWPQLGPLGWALLVGGFLVALYGLILLAVTLLGIDLGSYAPTEGEDNSSSIGLVKQAMFDLAHDPRLYLLALPSVTVGAPLAEELIFRGQLFGALSQTRLGVAGATLITSATWSLMHISEPALSMAMIFAMGLVFGYLLYRFGSLWVTMACHAAWNTIYSLIIFGSIQS